MKVCDVVKNSIWFDPRVKKQIRTYVENGVEVVGVGIFCSKYNKQEVEKIPCRTELVEIDDKYFSKKRNLITKIIRETKISRGIYKKLIKEKPDVIHANDLDVLVPAYKASKKLKCKLIYDTHEIFLENIGIVSNKLAKFYWGFHEKRIINKVDVLVCVSHAAGEYLKQKYGVQSPLVVTNCISNNVRIREFAKKEYPYQILNHGMFYSGRGYDIMIKCAPMLEKHEDFEITLRGYGSLEPKLREMAEQLNAKNVSFKAPVKVEELVSSASRAYVGLAITEAINLNFKLSVSNKIFEYAAAGLPVIMSDIPEHRYLNDKYNFGIILKQDTPEELAKAVEKLIDDKELYENLRLNSIKLSKEVNWENEFGKLLQAEYKLMENK